MAGSDGPQNNAAIYVTGTGVERGNAGRRRRVGHDDTSCRNRGRSVPGCERERRRGRGRGREGKDEGKDAERLSN